MKTSARRDQLTRDDWIDAGLSLLMKTGHTALTIDRVSSELGVTKGGFYHNFSDKDELISAMLEHYIEETTGRVVQDLAELDTPQQQLREALRQQIIIDGTGLSLAFRAWGIQHSLIAEAMGRVDEIRLRHAIALFECLGCSAAAAKARARVFVAFLHGESALFAQMSQEDRMAQLDERVAFFMAGEPGKP